MLPVIKLHSSVDILKLSPLVRGLSKTLGYAEENNGIGLTKSYALNRKFVHWAADNFDWPEYNSSELFIVNKVLNEQDMPPLWPIHDLLLHLKLTRRYKGTLRLTKRGQSFLATPESLFDLIAPAFLFQYDHDQASRSKNRIIGNWDIFLNIINVEAQLGCSVEQLLQVFYGLQKSDGFDLQYSSMRSDFRLAVVRPLCWLGLLEEDRKGLGFLDDGMLYKTPLWEASLKLNTDNLKSAFQVIN
jgi:hypothetical protein